MLFYKLNRYWSYFSIGYFMICPLFAGAYWCSNADLMDVDCLPDVFPNSGITSWNWWTLTAFNIFFSINIIILCIIRLYMKKRTKSALIRTIVLLILSVGLFADNVVYCFGIHFRLTKPVRVFIPPIFM